MKGGEGTVTKCNPEIFLLMTINLENRINSVVQARMDTIYIIKQDIRVYMLPIAGKTAKPI